MGLQRVGHDWVTFTFIPWTICSHSLVLDLDKLKLDRWKQLAVWQLGIMKLQLLVIPKSRMESQMLTYKKIVFMHAPFALCACSVVADSLRARGLKPTRLLCPWDSPGRTLEWAAIPFSRGSSQSRDPTQVSRIGRDVLYHWAPWEAMFLERVKFKCFSVL